MAKKGEKRKCPTCNEFAEVMELIPSGDDWYMQKNIKSFFADNQNVQGRTEKIPAGIMDLSDVIL